MGFKTLDNSLRLVGCGCKSDKGTKATLVVGVISQPYSQALLCFQIGRMSVETARQGSQNTPRIVEYFVM